MRTKKFFLGALIALGFISPTTAFAAGLVSDVTASSITHSSVEVSWINVSSAPVGYLAELSTAPDFTGTIHMSSATDTEATGLTVTGLFPNATFYLQVGAIDTGTTTYTAAIPPTLMTMALPVQDQQFLQVTSTTIKVGWSAMFPPAAIGYLLEVSTASDFTGTLVGTATPNLQLSTLTVSGLPSGTTFFARVGTLNHLFIKNWVAVAGATTTLPSDALPPPSGFTGTATSVSAILWSWNLVSGATGYTMHYATSPTLVANNIAGLTYSENSLVANSSHTRVVKAWGGGQGSPASSSHTVFSWANTPAVGGTPVSQVNLTSFTVSWGTSSNPSYTQYEVSYALDAAFSVGVTTPVPFTNNLLANTTSLTGLTPLTTYYVRVRARNGDGIPTNFGPPISTTTLSSSGAVGGGGTASILPAMISEGAQVQFTTITFIVPAGGFGPGGGIKVQLPFSWGPYLQTANNTSPGFVTALSSPFKTLVVTPSNTEPSVTVVLAGGQTLTAGATIQLALRHLWSGCPPPGVTTAHWTVHSLSGAGGTFQSITSQPTQPIVAGYAKTIWFTSWDPIAVVSGQASQAITLAGRTYCGNPAPVEGNVVLQLNGVLNDYFTTDTNASFSTDSGFATIVTSVTISTGATQSSFYYKTTTLGTGLGLKVNYADIQSGAPNNTSRPVNVFTTAITFSGLSLDGGTGSSGSSTFALSPDNDGLNDFVFVRFTPSDSNIQWRVRISSDGFTSWVYERWGSGDPLGTLQWDGRNNYGSAGANSFVPNATYVVRVEIPGLTPNTSLSIAVSGASIAGRVRLGTVGMPNVWVNANATSGYGFGGAMTDGNGDFTINGLRNAQSYNLYANFYDTTTFSPVSGSLTGVIAPATGADITVSRPAQIRVAATLTQAPVYPLFGQINARTTNYSQNYWASIRFQASSTTSDNGDYYNPSTWTVLAAQPGTYTVQLNLPGFSPSTHTVTVAAGQTVDAPLFNMTRPANVYGMIHLPTATVNSTWISVDGIASGNTHPSIWGGAFFNVGQSSAVFQIFNVPVGSYNFRVRPQGYIPVVVSTTVGTSDIGNPTTGGLDISSSSFGTGGKITGLLTVNGDTSNLTSLNLWINAYSPSLGSGEFTQVQLATHAVTTNANYQIGGLADGLYQVFPPYLQGFELNPPGPQSVTVTGGVGTLPLTLTKNTGAISGSIDLGGATDWAEVSIYLNGPNISTTVVASGATYTISNLGSGFYDLIAIYGTTGAQVRQSVGVVNGLPSDADLQLDADTFVVTGSATISAAFNLNSSSGAPVTISTIEDLLENATTQYFYINGAQQILPTARVEAFPKRFDTYGTASRTGFGNTFFAADFKYGAIQADGSYSIAGLSPGVWEISVYPYLDGGFSPSLAVAKQTLTISNTNQADIDFALSGGFNVGGTISLPGGATDDRNFDVLIVTDRGDHVQSSYLHIGTAGNPANSTTFLFKNLPNGRYALIVTDPGTWDPILMQMTRKFSAKPVAFEINGANIPSLSITMARASRVVGKLSVRGKNSDGTPSSTLVTSNNTTLLPTNFRIAARANPWVEGGYQEAARAAGMFPTAIEIDSNNQFHIDGLVPGVYDVEFRQDTFGASISGQGSLNLAYYVQGQVVVTEGQSSDLGTVELKQGLTLTGTVQDTNGNYLPNIRVRAEASGKHDYYNNSETFTDTAGKFSLTGINPDLKSYDVVAAPRPSMNELRAPSAYGQVKRKAIDLSQSPLPTVNFVLEAANASLNGQVNTADSGPLGYPDGEKQQGYPVAAIYMQKQGVAASGDDPLGDIRATTNLSGSFSVTSLVPGTYDVRIISLNYKPHRFTMVVAAGSNSAGTITLESGAVLNATVTKPDGSGVSENDVHFAVAVTADLSTIIFGQITSDDNTRTVRSIRFSGFDSTKLYSVLLFDQFDNIISPNEGKNLTFTDDAEEKTLTLTYQASAPTAYVQVRKVGSAAEVSFIFSRALRNTLPADNTMGSLLTVVSGGGSLSSFAISGDRRSLTVLYTPAADEQNASLTFSGATAEIDQASGLPFTLTKNVVLRFGQRAAAEQNINPVFGGEVSLAESDGDPSGVTVPANALIGSNGSAADADATYGISFTATEDAADLISAPGYRARGARAAALTSQIARGESAYVSEAYHAMQAAHAASVTINPLSSFYSVLLPAGLSHTLNESATLTLQYDSGADPNSINIYFFDGSKYLLESANRTIDTVNRTISVTVSHFSTFVVLENTLPIIITDGDAGSAADLQVFNFPNPFDLTAKTKTLTHGGSTSSMDTNGTIIRYLVPAGKEGFAHLEIFNVAGDRVRSITLGNVTADTYHYVSWDGKNDAGNNVASGVYVGMLKVGGNKKTWKMAVIK